MYVVQVSILRQITWLVRKKGSKCLSWKSFSRRARLFGADQSWTGSVVSSMCIRPAAKAATTAADTRRTLNGCRAIRVPQFLKRDPRNSCVARLFLSVQVTSCGSMVSALAWTSAFLPLAPPLPLGFHINIMAAHEFLHRQEDEEGDGQGDECDQTHHHYAVQLTNLEWWRRVRGRGHSRAGLHAILAGASFPARVRRLVTPECRPCVRHYPRGNGVSFRNDPEVDVQGCQAVAGVALEVQPALGRTEGGSVPAAHGGDRITARGRDPHIFAGLERGVDKLLGHVGAGEHHDRKDKKRQTPNGSSSLSRTFPLCWDLVCLDGAPGVVTQLQDNHGMVDQEVHFQTSVVVGRIPQLGEKVLVKAPYKSPPPLLPSMASSQKPGILGSKPQPLLKSPKIPPLIPSMQQNPPKPGLLKTPHIQAPWGGQYDGWCGGNRKRHNEGLGGRRGGRWEEGAQWGGDGVHQKRRRWRGALEDEQKKRSPPPPKNCALFSRFPRDSTACDSLEVQRRYPHLPLPESFFHLQLSWTESFPANRPLPLSWPCPFHMGPAQPLNEPPPTAGPGSAYIAKVILLSVPSAEELYRKCCGLSQDQQEPQGGALLGGPWCPETDGANPEKDPLVLIRTAVRCVKEQTGLDLSHCCQWNKMAEVRYLCGGEVETLVIYLPDNNAPSLPEEPSLVVYPCPGTTLTPIPLSSLLEPRNAQTQDAFEVGLSAELLSEMLQRDFGLDGKRRSRRERESTESQKEEEKDKSGEESDEKQEENKDGESEPVVEEGKTLALIADNSDGMSGRDCVQDRPPGWSAVLPRRVLLSWVFFDRQLVGSLRSQDLQDILLSLGLHLTPAQARELVNRAVAKGGTSSRRSCGSSVEVVMHKGTVLSIPNLLLALERADGLRQGLERRIAALQDRLAGAESEAESVQRKYSELLALREGQEELKERLEKAERRNSTYEKSLKENAGHMIAIIEKMQKLVDKTTTLAESRTDGAEKA
ncbi:hypothetical protein JZ751_004614 [Albula glossodonta]|uniref:DBC1/CARP1 catalytically inactive NUDIX hydrolase domain-containing protein n=1 Tax=Albula glossodonta TaxID=121402 RepID=A0A8T2N4Z6_9TELE|nr:hypothetical protein JZ751_004614 [Albula glossodonta]